MKYCEKCELHFEDDLEKCPTCGEVLETEEDSTIPFTIVAFLIPVVGLIMFLASFKSHPKRAKFIVLGAIIGILIQGVLGYIFGITVETEVIAYFISSLLSNLMGIIAGLISALSEMM